MIQKPDFKTRVADNSMPILSLFALLINLIQSFVAHLSTSITSQTLSEGDNDITAEDVLIAAYDVISQVFSQEAVIRAYYRTDQDTMALRDDIYK